jgi:NADPH:quinone reductase-like Zn-dependent oxidoreductase
LKAVVCTSYGPPEVLQLREAGKPVPGDDEVLVRVRATAVTASDLFIRAGGSELPWRYRIAMRVMIGLAKPRRAIIGEVLAGEIETAGRDAKRFKTGDQVYGVTGFGLGAYAEYTCMKETDSRHGCLAHKPAGISFNLKLDSGRLAVLTDLIEAGHVKPVIDRCYPLEKIAEAHRYVGEGHKKGGVAITI